MNIDPEYAEHTAAQILEYLQNEQESETLKSLVTLTGQDKAVVKAALRRLKRKGLISRDDDGSWELTMAGIGWPING